MAEDDLREGIRRARDHALTQEQEELDRIAAGGTAAEQSAASVRLATRQAVREALDDVLGEQSEQPRSSSKD
ncbi:hypothetical protein BKD30_07300 [Tersicoccus phoenicis]|uniref:Uncharacterized protein n=1 Tax=Tersicoccus phoenicis TaxID=554083 RepID=A0A1R1LBA3_9MICC|nr:hypothetical protein [Tersicoccus phoenicis]OMH24809.1 hypothetical protein BKD30_07300 [Tersicoccus phoenicis]